MDKVDYLSVLMNEVSILERRIQLHDTGHIHTTIAVLKERIEEVKEELRAQLHD